MTMVSDWLGPAERDERETESVAREAPARETKAAQVSVARPTTPNISAEQKRAPAVLAPLDPELKKLLERGDDRLLRDVGLSRESPFAEVAKFWAEWSRQRGPWGL